MYSCSCPAAAALTTIPSVSCGESFGQIQKIAFQRLKDDNGDANAMTSASVLLLATWTALMAAANSTKIVVSPYVQAPTNEPGAARTFGGGNETLGGVEMVIGSEPSAFTGVFRSIPQSVIKVMKELQCEALAGNLGVFLFDENGKIEGLESDGAVTPIPIRSLFVSDKGHGGLEAPDYNNIQWQFLPNWSDNLAIFTPTDFNPLTDLTAE